MKENQSQDLEQAESTNSGVGAGSNDAQYVLLFIKTSLRLLSMRVAVHMGMVLGFIVTVWAMAEPEPYRVGLVVVWWFCAYLPTLLAERNRS